MKRRTFLKSSSLAIVVAGAARPAVAGVRRGAKMRGPALALNAYSFNRPLRDGTMNLDQLFAVTRKIGFTALDLTAYYIPGYPEVPSDKELNDIKNAAFRMGLAISGTGVRNDFTVDDPEQLEKEKLLVKRWIVAASKLGAPHVRVFDGRGNDISSPRPKVISQVIDSFRECAEFAADYGVMVNFQNHNEYIKVTGEVLEVLESLKSAWFGLMLDIGSIIGSDPYRDIEKLIPYATTWQVKENVRVGESRIPTDFEKLMQIVRNSGYQGYFPLETLGAGDPEEKVSRLFDLYQAASSKIYGS
jgi:sugar phosphate isomerase/epimerase